MPLNNDPELRKEANKILMDSESNINFAPTMLEIFENE
jgi:hypothetical protein